jgi:hypothetical protein
MGKMLTYFSWWYYNEPIYLWHSVVVTTKKVFYSFSIPLLLRTLFAPWKKDVMYLENASLSDSFQIFIANMVSRLVGAIVRFFTIIAGLVTTLLTFILGLIFVFCWLLIPVIIIYLFISGVKNLNG